MTELLVFMADALSIDEHVAGIEKAIAQYKSNPNQDTLNALEMTTVLFNTKTALKKMSPDALIQEMNKSEKVRDLLTPKEN